ncbi:MAG: redoxin domain-containing protein, partial [Singulisphaera sp.]|nr:redoxin domain-containing protein [Singulisphaera sp.]
MRNSYSNQQTERTRSLESGSENLIDPILSDPSKSVAEAYGVLNPGRGVANRWTFYIDKDGIIKAID